MRTLRIARPAQMACTGLPARHREVWAGLPEAARRRAFARLARMIARAAMTSTAWRRIAVYSRAWHWSRPMQSLKSVTHCRTTPTGFQQKWKSPTLGILWLVGGCRSCLGIAGMAAHG